MGLSLLGDKFSETGHVVGTRDSIIDIGVETDAQLFGGRRQGHESIPSLGAFDSARSETDFAFAHALTCPEFSRVVMQGDFGMIEHLQQVVLFGVGLGNAFIQDIVTRHGGE